MLVFSGIAAGITMARDEPLLPVQRDEAMADERGEGLMERTLANLAEGWREIAASAARSIGMGDGAARPQDARALRRLMVDCLEARGGEVSARMRAAELGENYLGLDPERRAGFLTLLARDFAVDRALVERRIAAYRATEAPGDRLAAESALRAALVPPRVKLLTQFNVLPEGVKFLSDLRADLLQVAGADPDLRGLERDLRDLLESWFDVGFLDLQRITWSSPAALLEKLIDYEAVHEIRSWEELRHRLESDRRLYALFHPRMQKEPLAFVEVALVRGLAGNIRALLDGTAPKGAPERWDTAIFYSISNTQKGLRGISFGEYLIKRVVQELSRELPRIRTFATLSPLPGFMRWLGARDGAFVDRVAEEDERGGIRALGGSDDTAIALKAILARPDWIEDPVVRNAIGRALVRLCGHYLVEARPDGQPIDPVARFHLKNGARLERINWAADTSQSGLRQAAGLMVNYRYLLDEMDNNHEAYMRSGRLALSSDMKSLVRSLGLAERARGNGGTLRRSA